MREIEDVSCSTLVVIQAMRPGPVLDLVLLLYK
jgi:hypothetical protein